MFALVMTGPDDQFIGIYEVYETEEDAEDAMDRLDPLLYANIEGTLPLSERLKFAPYFPFAGRVQNMILLNLDHPGTFLRRRKDPNQ